MKAQKRDPLITGAQARALKAYLATVPEGVPLTVQGSPHHAALCTLIPLGIMDFTQVDGVTYWSMQISRRRALAILAGRSWDARRGARARQRPGEAA